ncbi:type IV toxin-antitoxin system AbiEi family antitoxin domain-containing protein [Ruania halotolerans]|uniref:type IV toxin-antitoxin system AbiEi family antitoxin domain-containing protein n=1 Tax=Ruania halotolerans TaxID=2897773 RepID=UPI001E2FA5E1|nr:type IV toxin-antitoxin system AbiEi family antitoxin domain-containing protein [Ruania halotolerans]UFU06209.1 type IV toxin-antitoxin system AbiEi family antitoxin domain-containing protein [Ruania halotolerans]
MRSRLEITHPAVVELRLRQDGVITRRQLFEAGAEPHDLQRLVRRREIRRIHPGVYVDHTGPLTRRQREWAAVLGAWPAALAGPSALPGPPPGRVHIAIARGRTVSAQDGVVVHCTTGLQQRVLWQRSPPRLRIDHATIDGMSAKIRVGDVAGAFADLARVVGSRQTTIERILATLEARSRVHGRTMIAGMLTDVRDGACSVLERGYRDRIERAHGLPRASRQYVSAATGATTFQDVRYERYSLVVELDGYAFHSGAAARDNDADRDLAEPGRHGCSHGARHLRLGVHHPVPHSRVDRDDPAQPRLAWHPAPLPGVPAAGPGPLTMWIQCTWRTGSTPQGLQWALRR